MTETELEARKGNENGKKLREVNGDQEPRGMIEQNGKQETETDGRNSQTKGRTLGMITKISESGGQSVLASKKISLGGFITEERSAEAKAKASESTKKPMASGRVEESVSDASAVGETVSSAKERQPVAAPLRTEKASERATEKGAARKGMTGTTNESRSGESTAELKSGAGVAGRVKTGGKGGKAMRSLGTNKRGAVAAEEAKAGAQLGKGVGKAGAGSSNNGSRSGKEGEEGPEIRMTTATGNGAFACGVLDSFLGFVSVKRVTRTTFTAAFSIGVCFSADLQRTFESCHTSVCDLEVLQKPGTE